MKKVSKVYQIFENANIMPLPLEQIKNKVMNNYDKYDDLSYMRLLQSRIGKIILPYVDKAIAEEMYAGSPIYNGYIDKDTIGTIVDKTINYLGEDLKEVTDIIEQSSELGWSKNELLRALVQTMVLHELYAVIRPNNQGSITVDNNKSENIVPIEMTTPMDVDTKAN